jgi:glutathione S-transferase
MKLFRLRYSPYARKVQMLLDLMGRPYECVEVPYGSREELARLTGGYIEVPVLVDDGGAVIVQSRDICEALVRKPAGARFVPPALEAGVWAYSDFVDGPLEDPLFRLASPFIRDQWKTAWERALYTYIKERKFGTGCIDAWKRDREALLARGRQLLAPSVATLERQAFLFGDAPTLADASLYGLLAMLAEADPALVDACAPSLPAYMKRLEKAAGISGAA